MGVSSALRRVNKVTNNRAVQAGKFGFDSANVIRRTLKAIRAVSASWLIGTFVIPFWCTHLIFWIVALAGIGVEANFFTSILPGVTVFQVFSTLGVVMGLLMMMVAGAVYAFRFVPWWRHPASFFGFGVCLCLSVFPYTFGIFPWVLIWCVIVVAVQSGLVKDDSLQTGDAGEVA